MFNMAERQFHIIPVEFYRPGMFFNYSRDAYHTEDIQVPVCIFKFETFQLALLSITQLQLRYFLEPVYRSAHYIFNMPRHGRSVVD